MPKFILPLLLSLAACGGEEAGEFDAILALDGDETHGDTLYASNCAGCHGADGTGGVGPDLTASGPAHSDEQILEVVFYGSGSMPAYGETLSDQDLADLLAYCRHTYGAYEGHGDDHEH